MVSRVLNGKVPVESEKVERIHTAIAELQFVPRTAARVLASRKTNTIGLILSEIDGAFFPHMLKGIEAESRAGGYELLIHSTQGAYPNQNKPLGEHNTDGILVFPSSLDLIELRRLYAIGFPVVLMHQSPPDELSIPVITIENKDGTLMLINHLIEKHARRRIVFMRGPDEHEDSQWRERGYREALELHNIPFDPDLIVMGGFDEEQACSTIQQILKDGVEFDAVFTGGDDAVIGVYRALNDFGRLIPDNVAVVRFDDIHFARYISPALTTIRAPTEEVGRKAVQQLIHLIRGESIEFISLHPVELIIRNSCGCN